MMMMMMMATPKSQPLLPIACHPNAQGQYFRRAEPPEKEEILKAAIGLNDLSSRSSSASIPSSSEQEAPGKPRINAKPCVEEEAERAGAPSFGRLVANSGNQPCAAFIPYPHHHLPQSSPQPQPYPLFPQFATTIAKSPSASSSFQSNSLSLQQQLHHPQAMPYFNLQQQPFLAAATTNTNNNYNLQNTPTTAHPFATPVPSGHHLQPPPQSHPHPLSHPPQSPYSWPFHLIPPTMHAHNTVVNNTSKETGAAATTTATTTMNSKATPSSASPQQGTAEGSAASAVQHTPHRAVTQTSATNSFSPLSLMLAPTDLTAVAAAAKLVSPPAAVSKEGSQNRTSFLKRKRSSSSSKPKTSSDKNNKEQSPRKEGRRTSGSRTRVCTSCKTENSPIWRRGENNMRLCNACGLKHRRSLKKKATASQQSSALPENAPSSPSPPASSSSSSDKPSASAPSSSTTCVTSSPLSSVPSPRSSFSSSPSASFSIPCPPSFSSAAPSSSSWPPKATSSSKISIASLLN